jgi:hypothetical protein
MALAFTNTEGTQIVPGATVSWKASQARGGNSTGGIVVLVGEADSGPDFTLESDLNLNAFGPDQAAKVKAKYKSGPIVDAFGVASQPMNDEDIPGSPSRIIIVKTNPSGRASASLKKWDTTTYGTILDQSYGKSGNNLYFSVAAAQAEVLPSTSSFTWIPTVGTCNVGFRVNGGALLTANLGANATPAAVVTAVDALAGVAATGGAARTTIQASTGTLAVTVLSGNSIRIDYSGTFTTVPSIGDTVYIPTNSVIDAGAGDQNVGGYVVTASASNSITCTKLSDGGKAGAVAGVITAPLAVGAAAVTATVANDLVVYAPVTFTLEAGNPIDGIGKSVEICELTSGGDLLSRAAYALSTTQVTWVSKTGAAKLVVSGAEYRATLSVARQTDSVSEDLSIGGEIGLKISYLGTTASLTIDDSTLTTTVVGGTGANLNLDLKDYPTISDLAVYINAQTGYKAVAVPSAGQLSPLALDDGTFNICSQFGEYNARLKTDGYRFFEKVSGESILIQINNPAAKAASGLPAPTAAVTFLAGGTRGGTTALTFQNAITAMERVRCNFVAPLFSRDAAADIADKLTDSTSTYAIDTIHALVRTHILKMAKIKQRKNRQSCLSYRGTFADAMVKAQSMATFRSTMSFLDKKVVSLSDGTLKQFQPWMDAVIAAAGQAAAGYRNLTWKYQNISGSLQAAGDWSDQDIGNVEDAIKAGLLVTVQNEDGGYQFKSDQTTYGKDSNTIYNSMSAVYNADQVALRTAKLMEDAFAGKALADVSAQAALTKLESIMDDTMRLKLIAPSDDAPLGFKNANVTIQGPAMIVDAEIKVTTGIYFIPISFLVSEIKQSASQK